ncbi:MAG: P1 family peptidase, partial [Sphingomonadales bacterium]
MTQFLYLIFMAFVFTCPVLADEGAIRARDLGIPFDGKTGPLNAITDVKGLTVGHETIIQDLENGLAVRTGVTAILPRGKDSNNTPVFGASFALNGNGEMTGTAWLQESGMLEGPVLITNTHSVGAVHQAAIEWRVSQGDADSSGYWWSLPVVAETWDGYLNDINGFHVKTEHAKAALENAKDGPVQE